MTHPEGTPSKALKEWFMANLGLGIAAVGIALGLVLYPLVFLWNKPAIVKILIGLVVLSAYSVVLAIVVHILW